MYETDEEVSFETIKLDKSKHDFLGAITVYYDKEAGKMLFGVPVSKDEQSKEFLYNLIEELVYTVNPDGMEC
ncbi:MAG: hypothetical protein ACTSXD_02020 [Candidatus Heimdallarchaeaceae archaeon]